MVMISRTRIEMRRPRLRRRERVETGSKVAIVEVDFGRCAGTLQAFL